MYCLRRISLIAVGFTLFLLTGCAQSPTTNSNTAPASPSPSTVAQPTGTPCPPSPAPSPLTPITLSPCIPYEPTFGPTDFNSLPTAQNGFDVYSWRAFVALNWPTDPAQMIGANGDNPTVWESYIESYQVFRDDGSTPHWGPPQDVPAACQNVGQSGSPMVVQMIQKVSNDVRAFNAGGKQVLDEAAEPFKTGPLIDPHGVYTRYAILLNQDAFNYILKNNIYNKAGQTNFGAADFPAGDNGNPQAGVGAIVLKTAWRVLDPTAGDIPGRYHTTTAFVYTPASNDPPVAAKCEVKTLGLVGFHIMHKTKHAPQWVWSTFEQVDNLRVGPKAPAGLKPTYFNPDCAKCPVNKPPPKPWNPTVQAPPSQITRLIPIDQATEDLNKQWQSALSSVNPNSVWQFYELISTQWPTNASGSPTGDPAPQFLGNSTMETYLQGKVPNVSSSCIMCHNNATTTTGKGGDFSYLLQRAK